MEYLLTYATQIPDYVWQILAFLLPSNKFFQFLFGKLGYTSTVR